MKLSDLVTLSRAFTRDLDSMIFDSATITLFINQGINRLQQINIFNGMVELENDDDVPILLPNSYHYILALFASSRLFDMDERFHEGTEKRNEFENSLAELVAGVESGSIIIKDATSTAVTNTDNAIDYIKDEYFNITSSDTEEVGV